MWMKLVLNVQVGPGIHFKLKHFGFIKFQTFPFAVSPYKSLLIKNLKDQGWQGTV